MDPRNKDGRCCDVFAIDEHGDRELDYRYRPHERARYNAIDAARLRDSILQLAAAQDQLWVVIDNLEIEEGYKCTSCGQVVKHTRQCSPPRGLMASAV